MFSAMNAELFQPYGQVVDTDASIPVDVQDLEKHFQPVLLIGTPADRAVMRGVAGLIVAVLGVRRRGMCWAQSPATTSRIRALKLWSALTEDTTEQRRDERPSLMHITHSRLLKTRQASEFAQPSEGTYVESDRGRGLSRDTSRRLSISVKMLDRCALRLAPND